VQDITTAVVGLGAMGGAAATTLARAGRPVIGTDPVDAARARAEGEGVRTTAAVAEAVAEASVVWLSLPTPAHVLGVVDDLAGSLRGRLVVDTSTIDPTTAHAAAEQVAAAGGRYVDAPVLGRPASVGRWTLAAGGSEDDVAEVRSFATGVLAKDVQRIGDVGSGSAVKVLNNLMFGAINAVTAEVIDLAERAGISAARFAEVVADSGAATVSPLFRDLVPKMADGEYAPIFSLALLRKDVGLGTALARELGADAEVTAVVDRLTSAAVDAGHGAEDTSALVEMLRDRRR